MSKPDNATSYNDENIKSTLNGLKNSIAHLTENKNSYATEIPELSLFQRKEPSSPITTVYEPSICLVTQGAKRVILGADTFIYDPCNYLITSVNLPTTVQIIKASQKQPYLGLSLKFNLKDISQMIIDSNIPASFPLTQPNRGMATGKMSLPLLIAFKRLVDLLLTPNDIPVLSPLIQKEIIYRLLTGDQGIRLRQIVSTASKSHLIVKVLDWIKANFTQPLSIDDLTEKASMSASTFHYHFRSLTAMSPLQYIKTLRLHEARRLMLSESYDAASASFNVGYESPSQFNREYKRQFGDSPQRDIKKLSGEIAS